MLDLLPEHLEEVYVVRNAAERRGGRRQVGGWRLVRIDGRLRRHRLPQIGLGRRPCRIAPDVIAVVGERMLEVRQEEAP